MAIAHRSTPTCSHAPGPAVSLPATHLHYRFLLKREETEAQRGQHARRGKPGTLMGEHVLWPQMSFCLAGRAS